MKDDKIVKFNIDVIEEFYEDEDLDFSIMKLKFLSDGNNAHGIPITREILEEYASTIIGKPIVAKYNQFDNDVEGHELDEIVVGVVPNNAEVYWEESDNGRFACVDGVIFKLYAPHIYDIYKENNGRSVSVEMTINYKDNNPRLPVVGFNIRGVTLLGLKYEPSCTLASSEIVRFEKQADDFYENKYKMSNLQKFAERRKHLLAEKITYKVDKSKESVENTPWENVDKTAMRNKIMEATNKSSLVKSVYLKVEAGWEDAPSEHLKYPVMQLKNDTFVYNENGISAAMGRARTNDSNIATKAENLQKKLGLYKEGEKEKMQEEKKKLEKEVTPEDEKKKDSKEEKLEDTNFEEQLAEAMQNNESLTAQLAEKEEIIMGQKEELEELRKFKSDKETEEVKSFVDNTLAEVKDFVSEDTYKELQMEGASCSLEQVTAWENKARSVAFSKVKEQVGKDGVFKMGIPYEKPSKSDDLWAELDEIE